MTTITTVVQPKRMYSWWWDSHISPKNSKWLTENLEDMDSRVRMMIKLIEEDADSFGRRAEMYYKKRPELMKLVEEFYREYRALAERYDHATGALYQAHRTITRVFPNDDDTTTETGPHTPDARLDMRVFFTPDELMKDDVIDDVVLTRPAAHQSSVRKGLKFDDERETETVAEAVSKMREERDSALSRLRDLELESSVVRTEKEELFLRHERRVSVSDDDLVGLSVSAVQAEVLKGALDRLRKDSSLLRDQESERLRTEVGGLTRALMSAAEERDVRAERAVAMEKEICFLQDEVNRLYIGAEEGAVRLRMTEERCGSLAGSNRSLRAKLESLLLKLGTQCRELTGKQKELGEVWACLQEERFRLEEVEHALGALRLVHFRSQEQLSSRVAIVEAVERVRAENVFLENSVSDMSAELEATRERVATLEECCRSVIASETAVRSEKSALLVQLWSMRTEFDEAVERSVGLEVQVVAMRESIRKLLGLQRELEGEIHELLVEKDVLGAVLGEAGGEAAVMMASLQAFSAREAFFVKKTTELAGVCRDLCPTFEDCRVRPKDISLDRVGESSSETWRTRASRSGGDSIELRVIPVRDDENGPGSVLQRLDSDEEKLGNLRGLMGDLRRKVTAARKQRRGKAACDGVAEDLDGAEETAVRLLDVIRRLRAFQEKDDGGGGGSSVRKRFFEQARRVSERIGRLQVEVQKIQFVLVKMVNGSDGRGNGVASVAKVKLYERRTRILLRDYLYGVARITSAGRRQSRFCACARPQTDP